MFLFPFSLLIQTNWLSLSIQSLILLYTNTHHMNASRRLVTITNYGIESSFQNSTYKKRTQCQTTSSTVFTASLYCSLNVYASLVSPTCCIHHITELLVLKLLFLCKIYINSCPWLKMTGFSKNHSPVILQCQPIKCHVVTMINTYCFDFSIERLISELDFCKTLKFLDAPVTTINTYCFELFNHSLFCSDYFKCWMMWSPRTVDSYFTTAYWNNIILNRLALYIGGARFLWWSSIGSEIELTQSWSSVFNFVRIPNLNSWSIHGLSSTEFDFRTFDWSSPAQIHFYSVESRELWLLTDWKIHNNTTFLKTWKTDCAELSSVRSGSKSQQSDWKILLKSSVLC